MEKLAGNWGKICSRTKIHKITEKRILPPFLRTWPRRPACMSSCLGDDDDLLRPIPGVSAMTTDGTAYPRHAPNEVADNDDDNPFEADTEPYDYHTYTEAREKETKAGLHRSSTVIDHRGATFSSHEKENQYDLPNRSGCTSTQQWGRAPPSPSSTYVLVKATPTPDLGSRYYSGTSRAVTAAASPYGLLAQDGRQRVGVLRPSKSRARPSDPRPSPASPLPPSCVSAAQETEQCLLTTSSPAVSPLRGSCGSPSPARSPASGSSSHSPCLSPSASPARGGFRLFPLIDYLAQDEHQRDAASIGDQLKTVHKRKSLEHTGKEPKRMMVGREDQATEDEPAELSRVSMPICSPCTTTTASSLTTPTLQHFTSFHSPCLSPVCSPAADDVSEEQLPSQSIIGTSATNRKGTRQPSSPPSLCSRKAEDTKR